MYELSPEVKHISVWIIVNQLYKVQDRSPEEESCSEKGLKGMWREHGGGGQKPTGAPLLLGIYSATKVMTSWGQPGPGLISIT